MRSWNVLMAMRSGTTEQQFFGFRPYLKQLEQILPIDRLGTIMQRPDCNRQSYVNSNNRRGIADSHHSESGFVAIESAFQDYDDDASLPNVEKRWSSLLHRMRNRDLFHNPCNTLPDERSLAELIGDFDIVMYAAGTQHDKSSDPFLHDLVNFGRRPIWHCPSVSHGIHRVVVAHSGDARLQVALEVAETVAANWQIPLEIAVVGQNPEDLQFRVEAVCEELEGRRSTAAVTPHLGQVTDIAELMRVDQLLVIGAYGDWELSRWFTGSDTESLLRTTRGPALVVPLTFEASLPFLSPHIAVRRAQSIAPTLMPVGE